MVEFGNVRYEELKKLLKKLAAAREARLLVENKPERDESPFELDLSRTGETHFGKRAAQLAASAAAARPPAPAKDSMLDYLEPDEPEDAELIAASSSAVAPSAELTAALARERDCEAAFLTMLDVDAHNVDTWFRSQKRYLRQQLAILEQQSRELKAADKAEADRLKSTLLHPHASPSPPPLAVSTIRPDEEPEAAATEESKSPVAALHPAVAATARARNNSIMSARDIAGSPRGGRPRALSAVEESSDEAGVSEQELQTARAALMQVEIEEFKDSPAHASEAAATAAEGGVVSPASSSSPPSGQLRDLSVMSEEQLLELAELSAMDTKLRTIQNQRDNELALAQRGHARFYRELHDASSHHSDPSQSDHTDDEQNYVVSMSPATGSPEIRRSPSPPPLLELAGGSFAAAPITAAATPTAVVPSSSSTMISVPPSPSNAAATIAASDDSPSHPTAAVASAPSRSSSVRARIAAPFSSLVSSLTSHLPHRSPSNPASSASSSPATANRSLLQRAESGDKPLLQRGDSGSHSPSPSNTSHGIEKPPLKRAGSAVIAGVQSLASHSLAGVQSLASHSVHGVETIHVHARLRMRLLSSRKPWETLRTAYRELYRGILLLKDFKMHNYTAFLKILKKHDKLSPNLNLHVRCMARLNALHVFASTELHSIQMQVEMVFARDFTAEGTGAGAGKNGQSARKQALTILKPQAHSMSHLVTFRLGLLLGLSLALFVVLGFLAHFVALRTGTAVSVALTPVLPIYRGLFLVILHLWFWGLNVHNFRHTRINYQFIFEIDPKTELQGAEVLQIASALTFLWILSLDLYLATALLTDYFPHLQPGWFHLALYLTVLLGVLCPFDILARSTRLYVANTLWHIVTTGWGPVAFRDFYTCNQLCSLVNVLNDLSYGICYYSRGDFLTEDSAICKTVSSETQWVIALLPYWFRFLQCLKRYKDSGARRQLWNACKYALSLNTTFWSSMHKHFPRESHFTNLWIACAIVSTIASYSWDIKADWGLLEWKRAPKGASFAERMHARFLRRERVIAWSAPYYIAILLDGVFRLAWVATISNPDAGLGALIGLSPDYFKTLIYSLEVLRRNQWNFYRMEQEHLTNVAKEKSINIVTLKTGRKIEAPRGDASAAAAAAEGGGSASDFAPSQPRGPMFATRAGRRVVMCPKMVVGCAESSVRWVARCFSRRPGKGKGKAVSPAHRQIAAPIPRYAASSSSSARDAASIEMAEQEV